MSRRRLVNRQRALAAEAGPDVHVPVIVKGECPQCHKLFKNLGVHKRWCMNGKLHTNHVM